MKKHVGLISVVVVIAALLIGSYMWRSYVAEDPRIVWNNANSDMITFDLIKPDVTVLPEFIATGKARGPWYFEASFPLEVRTPEGEMLAQVPAQAVGEWMTEEFVPFQANVKLNRDYSGPAILIARKDNPSGEPQNDASVEIPIVVQ